MASYPFVPPPPDRVGTPLTEWSGVIAERFRSAAGSALGDHPDRDELLPTRLATATAEVLGVSAVGISVMVSDLRVPLGASSEGATAAERLQFTTGEGPCLEGARLGAFIVADEAELAARWPQFASDLRAQTTFRSIISAPLRIAADFTAALDIYLGPADDVGGISLITAWTIGHEIAQALHQEDREDPDESLTSGELTLARALTNPPTRARTLIWIATGILIQAMSVTAVDALAIIRAYAYSHDLDVDVVARRMVDRSLSADAFES